MVVGWGTWEKRQRRHFTTMFNHFIFFILIDFLAKIELTKFQEEIDLAWRKFKILNYKRKSFIAFSVKPSSFNHATSGLTVRLSQVGTMACGVLKLKILRFQPPNLVGNSLCFIWLDKGGRGGFQKLF